MKYSRNPKSGIMEEYTDDGVYVGNVVTMGDVLSAGAMAKDGGPGSGNWGHAGRPGKVGGSQKGGGGQYRAEKTGVGYFSSRKDWLNGLQGEEQHKAVRFVAKQKREFQDALEAKKKVESLAERGLLTKHEAEEQIKRLGMTGLNEKSPIEMFIIQRNSPFDVHELFSRVSNARNWPENHERLKNANLTEEEKKVFDYTWNNDDPQKKKVFNSLYAKALGIPHPEVEIPEEFLYESGAKERPKTKYDWYRDLRGKMYSSIEGNMSFVVGKSYGYAKKPSPEEFEALNKEFVDTMRYGKLSPIKCRVALKSIGDMRGVMSTTKDERLGYYYKGELKITPEMVSRLDDSEKEKLLGLINRVNNNGFNPEDKYSKLEDVDDAAFDAVETNLQSMALRTSQEQQIVRDYVLQMEKLLTDEVPSEDDPIEAANKEKKEAEAQKHRDFIAKRDEEQKAFAASGGVEKKRKAIEAASKIRADELYEMDYDSLESVAHDFMKPGSVFTTSRTVPQRAYAGAILAYRDVIAKFPFLAGEFGGFGDRRNDAIASCCKDAYRANQTELMINYSKFTSESGLWNEHKTGMDKDWFVKVDEGLPMGFPDYMHELGHVLANWLHRYTIGEFHGIDYANGWRTGHYYDNEVATSLKRKTLAACKISGYDAIKREVSEYAAASRTNRAANQSKSNTLADEFFAECFCELMCSSNPRPVAREFGKQLDKFIKENGITADSTAMTESTMPKFDKGT